MKKSTIVYITIIILLILVLGGLIFYFVKCNNSNSSSNGSAVSIISNKNSDGTYKLDLDKSKWNYDEANNIYYQIGVVYCSKPETTDYESLGIYVPGDYFIGTKNSDGTYTCEINTSNKVGNYTAETAPIVMPINTAGYSAQKAPTSYSANSISEYLENGFVYVYSGCRGRYDNDTEYNSGAPWGVTDLKAAIRYLRYNSDLIPADTEKVFTFGHSGGGAQSALMGATGDSELYNDYLNSIGAVMNDKNGNAISDSVYGAMCWCPITNLDVADEAYEWNMGQFSTSGTRADGTFTKELSNDLAKAYAEYINNLGLKDSNGNTLELEETSNGIYTSGTYYDYVLGQIEKSLNNFLSDTTFPYTPSNNTKADGGFGGSGAPSGNAPSGEKPTGEKPSGKAPSGEKPKESSNSKSSSSTTYNTAQEYVDSLNSDETWIIYDSNTNTAKITSLEAFVKHCKSASKDVGAFDSLSKSQAENKLFGNASSTSLHFDSIMANILKNNASKYSSLSNWNSSYLKSYSEDLESEDSVGKNIEYRANMYNPMYYLSNYYDGNNTSNVAKYWRINTGITQGDTANVTEMNLALALQNNSNVKSVDFTTVWGQGHTTAERTGDSTTNFINWVNECLK